MSYDSLIVDLSLARKEKSTHKRLPVARLNRERHTARKNSASDRKTLPQGLEPVQDFRTSPCHEPGCPISRSFFARCGKLTDLDDL
jgi:hypothetical protein